MVDTGGLVALLAIVMLEATEKFFLSGAGVGLIFSGIILTVSFFLGPLFSTDFIVLRAGSPAGSPLSSRHTWHLAGNAAICRWLRVH